MVKQVIIELLNGLQLDDDGRLVNENGDLVHLRQGDMDGACGPYCVAMSLLVLDKIKRIEVTALEGIDYRTRVGRFLKKIGKLSPLVLDGADTNQVKQLFVSHNQVSVESHSGAPKDMIAKVRAALSDNCPAIMWVRSQKKEKDGLDHWTMAIGHGEGYIYLLDPSSELPASNFWNAVIKKQAGKNRFAYLYLNHRGDTSEVEVSEIIIVRDKSA